MTEINCDDFWEHQTKKRKSYLGYIPSQDFCEEEYDLFLSIATPVELQEDIITSSTFQKITTQLGWE